MRAVVGAVLAIALTFVVGCGGDDDSPSSASSFEIGGIAGAGGPEAWPAPPADQVAKLAKSAGLALEVREQLAYHVHAHLDVFIDGEHRTVPAGLGIDIDNPGVRTLVVGGSKTYGGIKECAEPCISPLHTHDVSGVLHTESATPDGNTLGQLFKEWDVRLDGTCAGEYCTDDTPIRVYVDGDEVQLARAADIPLSDHREIAVVIGDPPKRIPDRADFSQA